MRRTVAVGLVAVEVPVDPRRGARGSLRGNAGVVADGVGRDARGRDASIFRSKSYGLETSYLGNVAVKNINHTGAQRHGGQ